MRLIHSALLVAGLGLGTMCVTGCSSNTETATPQDRADAQEHDGQDHDAHADHDHGGWWCVEHGVPEEECALCDTSLVADFKANEDWCDEHNRPESQCFQCDPTRFDRFAARYEAKFGERPPQPTQ
jgi:hypothetical protein